MPYALVLTLLAAEPSGYPLQALPGTVRPWAVAAAESRLGAPLGDLPLYELDLALDDASGTFEGRLRLHYRNLTGRPLSELPLLLHPNAALELGARPGDQAGVLTVTQARSELGPAATLDTPRPALAILKLERPLAPKEWLRVQLRYRGSLRALAAGSNDVYEQAMSMMGGLGPGSTADYGLLGKGDGILTLASPLPLLAPFRDGAFQVGPPARVGDPESVEVANYRVRLVLPKGVTAVSDLVQQPPQPASDGAQVIRAEGALRRELVVVASRDFAQSSCATGATKVVSTALARDAAGAQAVLEAGCASLTSYEKLFGPYPYPQLELVEATLVGGAGGAEFTGLALVSGMLYRPPDQSQSRLGTLMRLLGTLGGQLKGLTGEESAGTSAPTRKSEASAAIAEMLRFTTAHEVAHQYFAGLVGNDNQRDAVVDEPLAQYAAGRFVELTEGPEAARKALAGNARMNYALYRTLGGVDGSAARPLSAFRSPMEYAALVYGKAPYFYPALRKKLGDARFDRCLRAAIEASAFKRVSRSDWVAALEVGCGPGAPVASLARRYFEQAHGDEDLKIDPTGNEVVSQVLGEEQARQLDEALAGTGLSARDLLRSLLGAGLGDSGEAPAGAPFNPGDALDLLH